MSFIVTAEEMRALDREVIEKIGVPGVVLMESAGRGVVEVLAGLCPISRGRFVVFAGPGNNGGDGFVIARHLANRGAEVKVALLVPRASIKGDARVHFDACAGSQVEIADATVTLPTVTSNTVIVDALFGTGLVREITGHFAKAIELINQHPGLRVAVDVPSGLDSDRGQPLGVCVRAHHTVTFAFAKRGLVTDPGFTYAGALHVIDIGIPPRLAAERGVSAELIEPAALDRLSAPRDPRSHKGSYGHLMLLAGSAGKSGAALLAGRAALRTGVGLCTVAAPEGAMVFDVALPELMGATFDNLEPLVGRATALAAGPGMPTDPSVRPLLGDLARAMIESGRGVLFDADALNHLAAEPGLLLELDARARAEKVVLTPHPGEASRLLGKSSGEIQHDRIRAAQALVDKFGCVAVLKGARTIVASPDGRLAFCDRGNPGLASGGTGDVLTGATGALLAQGWGAAEAARTGVFLQATAADRLAERLGTQGLLAHEVADTIPLVIEARRAQLRSRSH